MSTLALYPVRTRSHRGNIPKLPQTKFCSLCPAKFTRTTHLNRHVRSHINERLHRCNMCNSEFTRSDLLSRHKKTCGNSLHPQKSRQKSCQACAESKIKCDLIYPCTKCSTRGRVCIFVNDPQISRMKKESATKRRTSLSSSPDQLMLELSPADTLSFSDSDYHDTCSNGTDSVGSPGFTNEWEHWRDNSVETSGHDAHRLPIGAPTTSNLNVDSQGVQPDYTAMGQNILTDISPGCSQWMTNHYGTTAPSNSSYSFHDIQTSAAAFSAAPRHISPSVYEVAGDRSLSITARSTADTNSNSYPRTAEQVPYDHQWHYFDNHPHSSDRQSLLHCAM